MKLMHHEWSNNIIVQDMQLAFDLFIQVCSDNCFWLPFEDRFWTNSFVVPIKMSIYVCQINQLIFSRGVLNKSTLRNFTISKNKTDLWHHFLLLPYGDDILSLPN